MSITKLLAIESLVRSLNSLLTEAYCKYRVFLVSAVSFSVIPGLVRFTNFVLRLSDF